MDRVRQSKLPFSFLRHAGLFFDLVCPPVVRDSVMEIHLYRKVLYRGVLAICPGSRDGEDGRAEFHFSGGHTFQGRCHTLAKGSIEGDIWQAGADPDALILGISFAASKQILLKTLHVASPEKQTSSIIDKDIFITTYPVPAR
jgi:hypothetical protein